MPVFLWAINLIEAVHFYVISTAVEMTMIDSLIGI
jgi:hypothetical protein